MKITNHQGYEITVMGNQATVDDLSLRTSSSAALLFVGGSLTPHDMTYHPQRRVVVVAPYGLRGGMQQPPGPPKDKGVVTPPVPATQTSSKPPVEVEKKKEFSVKVGNLGNFLGLK